MTIIQKINTFIKKKLNFFSLIILKAFHIQKFSSFTFISFIAIFSGIFFISSNLISSKNEKKMSNFEEITKSNEFSNFTSFLFSKINSPYKEIHYVIKNNDTVEKILKKYKIKHEDINVITVKLKEKKLSNIYSGRNLSLIIKN